MKHHKHKLKPLQNTVISADAAQAVVINTVEELLDTDATYQRNIRSLRNQATNCALVNASTYRSVRAWNIGDAIRRAGLPLSYTRTYLKLCA